MGRQEAARRHRSCWPKDALTTEYLNSPPAEKNAQASGMTCMKSPHTGIEAQAHGHTASATPRSESARDVRTVGEGSPYLKIVGKVPYRIKDIEAYEKAYLIRNRL
jgi:hypothetical protein